MAKKNPRHALNLADWRAALRPDSRKKVVNKFLNILKRHLPVNSRKGLVKLRKMAERCEEKIYTSATSQSDYRREISLKMREMKTSSRLPNQVGTTTMPPNSGVEPAIVIGDWKAGLLPDSRKRIINKIMDTLKRHRPVTGPEGLSELRKIASRFEEKIYSAATTTSQSDYLRKISLKMLTMET